MPTDTTARVAELTAQNAVDVLVAAGEGGR